MSWASRSAMPCSRARCLTPSMKPHRRWWMRSGEATGPSYSRNWLRALKHSEVTSSTVSMASSARTRNAVELQLHPGGVEGGGQVDGDGALFHHVLPVLAADLEHEVDDARSNGHLGRWPVGHLQPHAGRGSPQD